MHQRGLVVPVIHLQVQAVRLFEHSPNLCFHNAAVVQSNDDQPTLYSLATPRVSSSPSLACFIQLDLIRHLDSTLGLH